MTIAVLGATGGTGFQVVQQALIAGYHVKALVRRSGVLAIQDPKLETIVGDVVDGAAVRAVTNGVHVVVSALGSRNMKQPTRVYSEGIAQVVSAMQQNRVRRLIAVSAVPVAPDSEKDFVNRFVVHPILYQFFGGGYEDMKRMEALLAQTDLDWTVFRPPALTNAALNTRYRMALGNNLPRGFMLSRASLAAAMIRVIDEPQFYRCIVTIAN